MAADSRCSTLVCQRKKLRIAFFVIDSLEESEITFVQRPPLHAVFLYAGHPVNLAHSYPH